MKKKTQELLLRKVERDLEVAIRRADYNNYGFLTVPLLKLMLQEMGILGDSITAGGGGDGEENESDDNDALLEQIAMRLNPSNLHQLDNGLVYDFFIRLLTNIRLPLHQISNLLQGKLGYKRV